MPKPTDRTALLDLGVDLQRAMDHAVEAGILGHVQRLVIYLHYWHGLTLREIAEALGKDEEAVREELVGGLRAVKATGMLEGYVQSINEWAQTLEQDERR